MQNKDTPSQLVEFLSLPPVVPHIKVLYYLELCGQTGTIFYQCVTLCSSAREKRS